MTRRDRCFKCNKFICGNEVCCNDCGESFCDGCVEAYDPLSRIAKLIAYVRNSIVDPELTDIEIEQLIQDLNSDELEQFLDKEYPIHDDNDLKYENIECREHFDAERNRIFKLYTKISPDFYEQFIKYVRDCIGLDDIVAFTCKNCFYK